MPEIEIELGEPEAEDEAFEYLLAKNDPAVNYTVATANDADADGDTDSCGACRFYRVGACNLVEGLIEADHVCDLYRDPPLLLLGQDPEAHPAPDDAVGVMPTDMSEARPEGARLFMEVSAFSDAPGRIPYLPKPGQFRHPSYGQVEITAERNARFVSNFANRIYGQDIPIDAEHQTKLSGAMGWVRALVQNSDGSVDAEVDWTDNGRRLLAAGGFRYFSPEWFDEWRNPATGELHRDVPVGGAITTRPFFKESHLRPLAAREDGGLYAVTAGESGVGFVALAPVEPRGRREGSMGAEAQETAQFAELQAELAGLRAAHEVITAERAAATARVAELEAEGRRKAFTDEVLGRSAENGVRWFGDVDRHVQILEALPEELRGAYVGEQRAAAARLAASGLFSELGSDAPAVTRDAWSEIEHKAKAYRENNPNASSAQAVAAVIDAEPALYQRYQDEKRGRGAAGA